MSKIFYDHIINLDKVEKEINKLASSKEEKEELWQLVDEIVHHRTLGCVLDHLPPKDHDEFLVKFHEAPYDVSLLDFLKEKVGKNIEELLQQELGGLAVELLESIRKE